MRFLKYGLELFVTPVLSTLFFAGISFFEPQIRSVLGVPQPTETSVLPESFGYILFFFGFLFCHLCFLVWAKILRLRVSRIKTNVGILSYSLLMTFVFARILYAPEIGERFLTTAFVSFLVMGLPFLIAELIWENFFLVSVNCLR